MSATPGQDSPLFVRADPRTPLPNAERTVSAGDGHVPGEVGLWVFIFGDLTLFAFFFVGYLTGRMSAPADFAAGAALLDEASGLINTIVLLSSSLTMAMGARYVIRRQSGRALGFMGATVALGGIFFAVKLTEYATLVGDGHVPTSSSFFTYYFVLTGIHLMHVVVGMATVGVTMRMLAVRRGEDPPRLGIVDGSAVYWHMVDVIWVALFALLYLVAVA